MSSIFGNARKCKLVHLTLRAVSVFTSNEKTTQKSNTQHFITVPKQQQFTSCRFDLIQKTDFYFWLCPLTLYFIHYFSILYWSFRYHLGHNNSVTVNDSRSPFLSCIDVLLKGTNHRSTLQQLVIKKNKHMLHILPTASCFFSICRFHTI